MSVASEKRKLMVMSSIALGGCGIWSMHFAGMNALQLSADGVALEMFFEPILSFLSLLSAICAVFGGLLIASKDPFFVNVTAEQRGMLITSKLQTENLAAIMNQQEMRKKIQVKYY